MLWCESMLVATTKLFHGKTSNATAVVLIFVPSMRSRCISFANLNAVTTVMCAIAAYWRYKFCGVILTFFCFAYFVHVCLLCGRAWLGSFFCQQKFIADRLEAGFAIRALEYNPLAYGIID